MIIFHALFFFATYVFSIDLLRGYYLFKYSEQYREQFGYSAKDWYGEKSKEYRRMQGQGVVKVMYEIDGKMLEVKTILNRIGG